MPKHQNVRSDATALVPRYALLILLGAATLCGGSARADVAPLLVLRPLGMLLMAYGLFGLSREKLVSYRALFAALAAVVALLLLHLIPLPPSLWHALPGRELIQEIDRVAKVGDIWRPFSLDPTMTRNALWAMTIPIAAVAFAVRLDDRGHGQLLLAVLVVGVLSGLLGVVQFAGGTNSPFYLYNITNLGSAVGFLANRNHQGVFLATLFPLLAAHMMRERKDGRDRNLRTAGSAAVAAMFIPMVLTTGSRAGFLTAALGLLCAVVIAWPTLRKPPTARKANQASRRWLYVSAAAAFLLLCLWAIGLAQGNSFDRLLTGNGGPRELRWPFWQTTLAASQHFLPLGSGLGSFVRVFQIYEPVDLLDINYVNHAHNDYLELLLDGGLPAVALVLAVLFLIGRDGWTVWRSAASNNRIVLGRAAFVSLVLFAGASAFDYPLRTPMLAAIACIYVVWLRRGALAARNLQSAD